jgi:hypothetical protein
LLAQHVGHQYLADGVQVQPGRSCLLGDLRQNPIDVLHHFPLLEEILALDAHGFAH